MKYGQPKHRNIRPNKGRQHKISVINTPELEATRDGGRFFLVGVK